MSVGDAFDALVATLDRRTPECDVLIESGRALALEIDTAQLADDKGKTKSASAAVTALQVLMSNLLAKGSARAADPDEADDWSAPAAVADLATVRDAKKPRARNARSRGSGGGAAAS